MASEEVDIKAIIREVMKDEGLDPTSIPTEEEPFDIDKYKDAMKARETWSKRYYRGRALGTYKCENDLCDHEWPSACGWCIVDLRKQEVPMRFREECKKGHKSLQNLSLDGSKLKTPIQPNDGTRVKPRYEDEESVQKMVRWAVNMHLVQIGRKKRELYDSDNHRSTRPHCQDLCEMCQILGRRCC